MDIILLFLAKPLDKHGTTIVHITYPPLSNLTDVVLSYDDTSKRVTVKCGGRVIVKLRGDLA